MKNTEMKMINGEELERITGGLEISGEILDKIDRICTTFPCDRIIMTNYGFKSPCLHRVRVKGIDNFK